MNLDVLSDGSERIRYQDSFVPLYICMADLLIFPNMTALCHWHDDVELLLAVKGHLSYNVNGQIFHIREGNAILVNSRQMHYGFSSDRTNCEYICICFRPDLLCASPEIGNRFVLPVITNPRFTHMILHQDAPAHRPLLQIIRSLWDTRGQHMLALGKLYEFWHLLFPLVQQEQSSNTDQDLHLLKQMLEYIRTHYPERISLQQIAASAGICRSKCCRIFRAYLHSSPNNYLTSFRLEKAMDLLRDSDISISEVAYNCGFSSASYFTEQFSRYKGITPTSYRSRRSNG